MSDRPRLGRARRPGQLGVLAAAIALAIGVPVTAVAAPPPARSVVAQDLQGLGAQESAEFFVYLREKADLEAASTIANKVERTTHVYEKLTSTAAKSQAGVVSVLDSAKVQYRTFWISNVIWVKGDKGLIDTLARRADVERIEAAGVRPLIKPAPAADVTPTAGPEWGLANIEAPRVWSEFDVRGEGIVVANIDGGVQYDHPALVATYRAEFDDEARGVVGR
ncbi:MAG: hypothetical protein FWJ93_15060 [Micromonosporaceae bacterium]